VSPKSQPEAVTIDVMVNGRMQIINNNGNNDFGKTVKLMCVSKELSTNRRHEYLIIMWF